MKKILSALCLLLTLASAKAQIMSNVIFFTENGERFYVILNGLRQNDTPQTNVKVTDLNANFYKMKVIFEDKTLGEKNFNLAMNEGMETSFVIKKNKKDEYVLRPVSETPVAQAAPAPANQSVVVYNPNAPVYDGGTVTHQSTTTTTTTNPPPANGTGFSMGVNVGENGGNVNMNVGGGNVDYSGASSTTHTTTTTTTVTHSSNTYQDPPPPVYSTPPPPPPSYLPGYNGPVGCPVPMSPQSFSDLKSTIESKSFEDSKMTIAKQVLSNNCLLVSQVKEIMLIFSFENTRLDFAKYAYDYTYDIGNYYKVNDAFTFESSITDLNNYIGGRRH